MIPTVPSQPCSAIATDTVNNAFTPLEFSTAIAASGNCSAEHPECTALIAAFNCSAVYPHFVLTSVSGVMLPSTPFVLAD